MKKLLLLTFTLLSVSAFAQSKMNFDLARKVNAQAGSAQLTDIFVQGNIEAIKELSKRVNGKFGYSAGDIAVVHIPVNRIVDFVSSRSVKRIEAYPQRARPMNDTMLINNKRKIFFIQTYLLIRKIVGRFAISGSSFFHEEIYFVFINSVGKEMSQAMQSFVCLSHVATRSSSKCILRYGVSINNCV